MQKSIRITGQLLGLLILAMGLMLAQEVWGYETDQFALPPSPLVDISPDISSYVHSQLQVAVKKARDLKAQERTPERFAQLAFENIDGGVKLTEILEGWLGQGHVGKPIIQQRYPGRLVAYRQEMKDSIYEGATWHRGFGEAYKVLFSSTIDMYGVRLGTDKLGHFFKQGHQYFELYWESLHDGMDHATAQRLAAYKRGVATENGIFGIGLSGVYSNADLFTNYSGMKFYQNLLNPVVMGGRTYAPMWLLDSSGRPIWNDGPDNAPAELMRRFVNWPMNEAHNPSYHDRVMRPKVKMNLPRFCSEWREKIVGWTPEAEQDLPLRAANWYGEDYGHSLMAYPQRELVTLWNTCP